MSEQLSSYRIKRGRRVFNSYSAVNSFSFALVTGNTVTLYAMALGASSTVVGLLGAFMYLSFFAIPLGKLGVARSGLVRTFAKNWMMRNWSLLPLLAIPYLASARLHGAAILMLVLGVFLFNLFRGMGLVANNPVIGFLAPGKDRGEYIVRLSLINNATALLATLFLGFLLWHNEGIETYNLVVLIGIVTGIAASALLFKLPEPASPPPAGETARSTMLSCAREAMREPNFRRFVASYLVIGLGIGMARPFIAVYCKAVYAQGDGVVAVFTVFSSLGALAMGAVMRLVIDRLGARPMYIIFASITLASLVPAIVSPGIGTALFPFAFLAVLSAVTNMGFAGQESAAQAYFFAMVPKERILDLSMVYYFILGGTGAAGAVMGGTFLDFLSSLGLSPAASFRLFFLVCVCLVACGVRIQRKLLDMGSYPVRDTLAVLFSPRDMRALTLLRKLDANEDPDEETDIIAELGEIASTVSAEELLSRLASPRFAVRYEALQSVSSLERLSGRVRDALLAELKTGEFSTAALAARLLGQFRAHQAVSTLREALKSPDYRLAGEAMLALANLADARGQFMVSEVLLSTNNPFMLVRGIQAMEVYGSTASIPILLDLLRNDALPEHIADETILTLSTLMLVPKKFYYAFGDFVRERKRAGLIILDAIEEAFSRSKRNDPSLRGIVHDFMSDHTQDNPFVRWLLDFGKGRTGVYSALLISVALDSDLNRLEAFRFFLCFWAVSLFEKPALIEK